MYVVHASIAVVVYPISWYLAAVDPESVPKIFVLQICTRIYDRYDDLRKPSDKVPRLWCSDNRNITFLNCGIDRIVGSAGGKHRRVRDRGHNVGAPRQESGIL